MFVMDNHTFNMARNKTPFIASKNPVTEILPSDIHRMYNLPSSNHVLLCQEILDAHTSYSIPITPELQNKMTDPMNFSNVLHNSMNSGATSRHCLNHPLSILPNIYSPDTSSATDYFKCDNDCSNGQQRSELSSPCLNHFCDIGHTETMSSSTPAKISRKSRNLSTHQWTCLCPYAINEINEYTNKQINYDNYNNNDATKYFSINEDRIQNSENFQRIHENCLNQSNTTNLSLLSKSSTTSPSTSFECARSFIRLRNARERERVRCVNAGYELLKRHLPLTILPDRRLAKVEILRGAINYINALKELLEK
ncbi:unnamed protein product [Trichobilharzia szidati]|nr:unnamed protein product [Trichobilharzia szidati]